jgi:hypothetical protein
MRRQREDIGPKVREVLKGTAFEPLLMPEKQVEFNVMKIKLSEKLTDSKEWNSETQMFDDISRVPIEAALAAASNEKVQTGETTSIADRSMWLSKHLVEGGTVNEGIESGQNRGETKAKVAPMTKLNRTPEEAKKADDAAAASLKLKATQENIDNLEASIAADTKELGALLRSVFKVKDDPNISATGLPVDHVTLETATSKIVSLISKIIMDKLKPRLPST